MSLEIGVSPVLAAAMGQLPATVPFLVTCTVRSSEMAPLLCSVPANRSVPFSGACTWVPCRPARVKSCEAW